MNLRHYGWVTLAVVLCLLSCTKKITIGPDGKPIMSCDEQIEELKRWLSSIDGYNQSAFWGQHSYRGDLVAVDLELGPVMGITPFAIRDDRFETCRENRVLFEKPKSQVEKFQEIAHDCRNSRIALYISPEAGWESITRVSEGIMRAGIFEVYFVFDSKKEFEEKPKDTAVGREVASLLADGAWITQPGIQFAPPKNKLEAYLEECPKMKGAFRGLKKRKHRDRAWMLERRLSEAMEGCDCTPPLSHIKSVIWPFVWIGQQRLSLLLKLALPGTEGCIEIAQDCISPWSKAHKAVINVAKEQKGKKLWDEIYRGKPLCLVSKALSSDKIMPIKIEIPLMEERKAQIKANYEKMERESQKRKMIIDRLSPNEEHGPDLLFRLGDMYYYKSRLLLAKEIEKYEKKLEDWAEEVKTNPGASKPKMNNRGSQQFVKASFDVHGILLKHYKDYHRRDAVLFSMAYNLHDAGKRLEGVDMYRQLIKEFPGGRYMADAYLALGEHFFDAGDYAEAKKEYENSAKHKDTKASFLAMYKIAWCHFRLGEKAEAREMMKKVAAEAGSKKLRGQANRELISIFTVKSRGT